MKILHTLTWLLLVIGGLNWLLSAFSLDLAMWFSASWWAGLMKVVYVLVGLSAIWSIFSHRKECKACETSAQPPVA